MSTVITAGNATNGLSLSADNAGTFDFRTGTGAGTSAMTIDASQNVVFSGGVSGVLKSGTVVTSTSGTSIDFTGIPSTAKRITVMLNAISFSGTSQPRVQLGTSSGPTTTGYFGSQIGTTAANLSSGFDIGNGYANAGNNWIGQYIICNVNGNLWVASAIVSGSSTGAYLAYMSGVVSLGSVLDRVRITSVNGTDTFDAGSINILYE